MARKYIKVSKCPKPAQEILHLANSIPDGYKFSFDDYPEFDTDKQKKWFFELVATLPKEFIKDKELLKMVVDGKTTSTDKIIKQKKVPFFEEVSKIPPGTLARAWREYLIKDGKIQHFYPLDILTKNYIQPAISCRRMLTIFCLDVSGLARHTSDGKTVLPGASIKDCFFTLDDKNGEIELAAHYPLRVIISEKLDARRFRVCPVCDNFFWAKRLDSKTCGKEKCAGELSGKTYHRENKEKINRKKREKYYIENEIDYCKICVTPINTHGESECPLNKRKQK